MINQDLLTIDELAKKLKIRKSWIYSRTRIKGPGSVPHLKIGKYLRFCLGDVLTWLKDQQYGN
jgi:predicted DNA-binding transcriptional regulator AlpA